MDCELRTDGDDELAQLFPLLGVLSDLNGRVELLLAILNDRQMDGKFPIISLDNSISDSVGVQ